MRRISFNLPFVSLLVCIAFSVVAGLLVLHGSDDQRHHVTVLGRQIELTASQSLGHQVFADHCAACHQLAASHSVGNTGPDLDAVQPSYQTVLSAVENGMNGPTGDMPNGLATGPDLYAVARYVARVANRAAYHP
ncbi:MAG TPA: cytochrome c [Solirubrobacteraceae bacterium]|nr:cytochrome c [Solirubrobacteraceae bacterium]